MEFQHFDMIKKDSKFNDFQRNLMILSKNCDILVRNSKIGSVKIHRSAMPLSDSLDGVCGGGGVTVPLDFVVVRDPLDPPSFSFSKSHITKKVSFGQASALKILSIL